MDCHFIDKEDNHLSKIHHPTIHNISLQLRQQLVALFYLCGGISHQLIDESFRTLLLVNHGSGFSPGRSQ